MDSLRADMRFGWRQLWKRKVITLAAVVSLGLAIGSCVAAFRLVDALFLRPMPGVSDPGSLYAVTYSGKATAYLPASFDESSYPFFEHTRDLVKGMAEVAAASTIGHLELTYRTDTEMEKAHRQCVSGNLFSMLGLRPALGRLLTEEDDRVLSGSPYAVISYDYWHRRFGGDATVIGRTFRMHENLYEIVGVGPKGFTGTEPGTVTDIFVPVKMEPDLLNQNWKPMRVFVRVLPDVQVNALADKLNAAYWQWEHERLKSTPKSLLPLLPTATLSLKMAGTGASSMQSEYGPPLKVLGVLVALVLLIACVNVANLMAGQAAARTREMAVRISLGSGRARLVRLVMAESAMLGGQAAALGLGFAWWATPYVVSRINPPDDPARLVLGVDWRIAMFAVLLALGVTALFGILPALRASGVRPVSALKGGEEPRSKTTWMQSMIAFQVAFCFVVLFLAGLFAATEAKLSRRPMGFAAKGLLLLNTVSSTDRPAVKWDQMAAALHNVPGVESTALENWPLISGIQHNEQISVNGGVPGQTLAFFLEVSPGWLDTMRISLVDGRDFIDSDVAPKVAMVNETFAKTFFGGRNPVGQAFDVPMPKRNNEHYTIVGLVKDVMYKDVHERILPQVYVPVHHIATTPDLGVGALQRMRSEVIAVRMASEDPAQMADVLRRAVTQIDPSFRVSSVTTQMQVIETQTIRERLLAALAGFFATVALLLSAVGLYGVLHYSVVQREREIGIRIALGAAAANIARIVSVRVMAMVVVGAVLGLIAGTASVRFVASLLYEVRGTDASIWLLPMMVLLAAVACAALPVVLRAVRINPATMLRSE